MAIVHISDFGKSKDGVFVYRINGDREDLQRIIEECKRLGFEFWDFPNIYESHKTYTMLLQIFVPKEMSYPEYT